MSKAKKMSLVSFQQQFGTEEQCREYLFHKRWPEEFVCPKCGASHHCVLSNGGAIALGSVIRSDGYRSYAPALVGYDHQPTTYNPDNGLLHWIHIAISNAKAFILGTYHGLPGKHMNEYLAEYAFRFSRRDFGAGLFDRVAFALAASTVAYSKG